MITATLPDYPFFLQAADGDAAIYYSATDFRRLLGAIAPANGILGPAAYLVTQADTVGWSVKVNSGFAMVGGYLVRLGSDLTIPLTGFNTNPTSPRTHKLWLSVYDKLTSGSEYAAKVNIVEDTGTGAGSPGAPVSMLLATLQISPGQANLQNTNIANVAYHGGDYSGPFTVNPAAGYEDPTDDTGGAPLRAHYSGGRVHLSGAIRRSGGTAFQNGMEYAVFTLTATLRPKYMCVVPVATSINTVNSGASPFLTTRAIITKDGLCTVRIPDGANPRYIWFDGANYHLD